MADLNNNQWNAHLIGGPHDGKVVEIKAPYRRLMIPDPMNRLPATESEYVRYDGLDAFTERAPDFYWTAGSA